MCSSFLKVLRNSEIPKNLRKALPNLHIIPQNENNASSGRLSLAILVLVRNSRVLQTSDSITAEPLDRGWRNCHLNWSGFREAPHSKPPPSELIDEKLATKSHVLQRANYLARRHLAAPAGCPTVGVLVIRLRIIEDFGTYQLVKVEFVDHFAHITKS